MKTLLQLEDAAKLILAYFTSLHIGYSWWVFFVWLFVPDISMAGYIINNRVGAMVYNVAHHQGVGIALFMLGVVLHNPALQLSGMVLFGHSAMDRLFGYGLKYPDSFRHTHLGVLKPKK